jgi:hypothetical protein
MTATYFIALHLYPFTYGDNFILCKKRKKAWNLPICTFDFSGSNLLTKFASASVNALFNDRLENTKKLLAHVIYSLKVVSNIENPLPRNLLCFADISHGLLNFLKWICCCVSMVLLFPENFRCSFHMRWHLLHSRTPILLLNPPTSVQ